MKPVIKGPRECRTILINPEDLKYRIFMCYKSKAELKGTRALQYIEWGENVEIGIKQGKEKGKKIIGYHNLSTVKGRKRWWDLGNHVLPDGVWQKSVNDRHVQSILISESFVDQRLYELISSEEKIDLKLALNNSIFWLFKELSGRVNLGEGVLDTAVYESKLIKVFSINKKSQIANFLGERPIENVFTECGIDPESEIPISQQEPQPLPDRKSLDGIVFDALGLTEEERKEVYRAVCQLVWQRLSKAKSVKKRRM